MMSTPRISSDGQSASSAVRWSVIALVLLAMLASAAVPAWAQASRDDDEDALLVEEARRAMSSKDYGKAAELLDRAIQVNPRRIDAYVRRAAVYSVFNQYDQAVSILERARALAPDNQAVLTLLGTQLILAKRSEEAVPLLEKVVSRWPARYDAHIQLGYHYVTEQQWQKAIVSLSAYFASRPNTLKGEDPTHRLQLANAHLRSGAPQAALDLYKKVLSERPESILGQLGVAWATAALDCKQAIPLLRKMRQLSENYPEILIVRGRCALLLGNVNEALATAEAYQKRRPKSAQAWALLGEARMAKKDIAGARAALDQAMQLDPTNRLYALKLARVERLSGQPNEAIARLREVSAPPGAEAEWTVELGESLAATGKYTEVRQLFAPFVAENPKNAAAQALLGIAIYELGEPTGAIQHLEEALKLDSGEDRVRAPLSKSLSQVAVSTFQSGDTAKAEIYLVRADAVFNDPLVARNLGAVRLASGKAQAAIAPLEKATDGLRDDDVAHHLLARAYHDSGDYKNARKVFKRAIRLAKAERQAEVAVDFAITELADGQEEEALNVLEDALKSAKGPAAERLSTAFIMASRMIATKALSDGNFPQAFRLLSKAEPLMRTDDKEAVTALQCDLALAATGSGQRGPALKILRVLESKRARCPFAAPANELAVQILIAWNEGATSRSARRALKRLDSLRRRAVGPAGALVFTAARDIAVRAAIEAYEGGDGEKARFFLETARKYDPDSQDIDHNLAVLDLGAGNPDRAIPRLSRMTGDVPEALVNLGIAYDLKNQPLEALEYYKRARAAGVRGANLKSWIEAKERLWGMK